MLGISNSFLFMTKYYSTGWTGHILFIHILFDGYLGHFHFGAVVNNAALNTHVQVQVWTDFFCLLCRYLIVVLLSHMLILYLTFWGTVRLFSKVVAPFSPFYLMPDILSIVCKCVNWGREPEQGDTTQFSLSVQGRVSCSCDNAANQAQISVAYNNKYLFPALRSTSRL